MAVSGEFLSFVEDQLERMGSIVTKKMFGGAGIYCEGVFFALIADDVLFFKVDDSNRPDYEAQGMGPFKPYGDDSYSMGYYEVPVDVLEDENELRLWAQKALEIAKRGKKKK